MYKKTGTAALVAAVSLTALAGCTSTTTGTSAGGGTSTSSTNTGSGGSGGTNLTPASALLSALTKSSSDNSVTINGTVSGGTTGTTTKLSGVEQFQPLKSSITITTSGGSAAGTDVSAIFDGTNYFIKSPQLSALEGGKTWLEFNSSLLGSAAGNPLGSMTDSLKMQSPTSQLGALVASGDLKQVGTETVDGQQATHYSGTMTADQAAAVAAGNGLNDTQVQQIKSLFAEGGLKNETLDVWVGSNGLPVRLSTAADTSTLGTTTTTIDFTNWGAPVSITDPPSSQVGTFSIPNIPGLPTASD